MFTHLILTIFFIHADRPAPLDCTAAKPVASLDKSYKQYSWKVLGNNQALEKVQLEPNVFLEVHYSGCEDTRDVSFTLIHQDPPYPLKNAAAWIEFAKSKLKTTKMHLQAERVRTKLLRFLETVTPEKLSTNLALKECYDKTKPTIDGCPLMSGGGNYFSIQGRKKSIHIQVGFYDFL